MKPLQVLLALENELLRQDIQYLLARTNTPPTVSEQSPSDWNSVLNRVTKEQPEVVLVELGAVRSDLTQALRGVKKAAIHARIIGMHSEDDPQTILAALRAGANEFVSPPYEENFVPAFERVLESRNDSGGPGSPAKVIGFLSAKGGCGSTTIACHIAAELRRQTGKRVLLADLDLSSGMVAFLMKVTGTYSILDAVSTIERLDSSLWKALVSEYKPGLDVIASPENFSYENSPKTDVLRQVIRFTRTQHDWIVLDLGRSLNEYAAALYSELDELFLISVLEVSALHGLKAVVSKLRDRGEDLTKVQLVLNRTPKMMDITQDELQKVLGRPLYAMLPNDYPSLYQSYSAGTLLSPNSRLAQHFASLTAKLAGVEAKAEKKKFSLFR